MSDHLEWLESAAKALSAAADEIREARAAMEAIRSRTVGDLDPVSTVCYEVAKDYLTSHPVRD